MHNKKRPHSVLLSALGALCLNASLLYAQNKPPAQENKSPPEKLPEYHAKPLPDDTFKPSEQVSEDFPVAFPVDI